MHRCAGFMVCFAETAYSGPVLIAQSHKSIGSGKRTTNSWAFGCSSQSYVVTQS